MTKRITTLSGLMQPGMKWIVSRNKRSSPHARAKWDSNHKRILNAPQGKLDICCQVQWETQGKTCCRWFSHPRTSREYHSGVVSLRHLRLVIFLGEPNNLELWGADIGSVYLEPYTNEKLFIIAGAEFKELERFILIFNKALYALKSSGKR